MATSTANNGSGTVLIVDDDPDLCSLLSRLMEANGHQAVVAYDGYSALQQLDACAPDILLVDLKMPGMQGMELMRQVLERDATLPVVVVTAETSIAKAVEALGRGAVDFLTKPFRHEQLLCAVRCALRQRKARGDPEVALKPPLRELRERMGPSAAVERLVAETARVADTDLTVVIQGETGSGKSLLARAIHEASPRAKHPFIALDCGAIPETLLESELFGYDKGAFTGADRRKPGQLDLARGGTLFLDEIANMSLAFQMKLLCTLQERTIYRVGGTRPIPIDVRVLAASNRDLKAAVAAGTFREDLYYRFKEFVLQMPPLRERGDDIIYLAEYFRLQANHALGKQIRGFSQAARDALQRYTWPGNVRELKAVVHRAVLLADMAITEEHLGVGACPATPELTSRMPEKPPYEGLSLKDIVDKSTASVECNVLAAVMHYTKGNKAKAARMLHVDYKTIHTKLKRYGIAIGVQ